MEDELRREEERRKEAERLREIERLTKLLEVQVKANLSMRSFYKWFLDFIRNAIVVAGLFFLADRSGDWWVYGIAFAAGFALLAYCYTYIDGFWHSLNFDYQNRGTS